MTTLSPADLPAVRLLMLTTFQHLKGAGFTGHEGASIPSTCPSRTAAWAASRSSASAPSLSPSPRSTTRR